MPVLWLCNIFQYATVKFPIDKFECCGKRMVTVIMKGRAACAMPELEYNKIIAAERKYEQMDRCKVA